MSFLRPPERVSLTPIHVKVEDRDTIVAVGPFQHLRVAKGTDRIVVAGVPLLLHAEPGERVVLGVALVVPVAIGQLDEAIDLAIGLGGEKLRFRTASDGRRETVEQFRRRAS